MFPSRLNNLIALEKLEFCTCQALKHVRIRFETITCLKILSMWGCEALEVFPLD
jgi:hypothetical protein